MEDKNLSEIINDKRQSTNIPSDNDIKQINLNKQKEYLDMELDRIRKMIEESKPVWILDDFEPFF